MLLQIATVGSVIRLGSIQQRRIDPSITVRERLVPKLDFEDVGKEFLLKRCVFFIARGLIEYSEGEFAIPTRWAERELSITFSSYLDSKSFNNRIKILFLLTLLLM